MGPNANDVGGPMGRGEGGNSYRMGRIETYVGVKTGLGDSISVIGKQWCF